MRCDVISDQIRDELQLGQPVSGELAAHARECAQCRALLASQVALDQAALNTLLALDEPHRPGPGFDTRFFAKLDEERAAQRKQRRLFSLRVWLWALVPAAAGIALLVTRASDSKNPAEGRPLEAQAAALIEAVEEPDDLALLADLELVEDLELVQQLEAVEDFEILADIDPTELDRIAAEQGTP